MKLLKFTFSLGILIFLVLHFQNSASGEPLDFNIIEKTAHNWLLRQNTLRGINGEIRLLSYEIYNSEGFDLFYLINYYPQGWVIISSDNSAFPIIAYNTLGSISLNKMHINTYEFIRMHADSILDIKKRNLSNDITVIKWDQILTDPFKNILSEKSVGPLLNTKWDQDYPWNAMCPQDHSGPGGHVYAGCAAVAAAQIMKYWEHPVQGTGYHSYHHNTYGELHADFGNTTYQWIDMDETEATTSTQLLLFHIGVSVEMNYGPNGSATMIQNVKRALIDYFGYHILAEHVIKEDYSQDIWIGLLKSQLDSGKPIYYRGSSGTYGHAFVCDGYDQDDFFHFNWGFSGWYDGYYYIDNLNPGGFNFSLNQAAIINVMPVPDTGYFSGGDGSADDPYIVETAEQLYAVRAFSNSHFLQACEIDLGAYHFYEGSGWRPIGDTTEFFQGNYNGNGFVIRNLRTNRPDDSYIGLFGVVADASLSGIGMEDAVIFGSFMVGALAGHSENSIISLCYARNSSVSGSQYRVGGLIGNASYCDIYDSFSSSSVSGASRVGGFAGNVSGSVLYNSFSTGNVTGNTNAGGLTGYQSESTFINSYWDSETSGQGSSQGGEGRTTTQMTHPHSQDTYIEWDFNAIWAEDIYYAVNSGYPFPQLFFSCEIVLDYFEAEGIGNTACISWRTITERNIAGFNLYRIIGKKVNPFISYAPIRLNESLILPDGGVNTPGEYSYTDYVKPNGIFIYMLEMEPIYGENQTWKRRLVWR